MQKSKRGFRKVKRLLIGAFLILIISVGIFAYRWKIGAIDKTSVIVNTLSTFEKIVKFLPIEQDIKKEIETVDKLVELVFKKDDVKRRYMLMLQNNMELRPGGGFLGQYAVVEVKNGDIVSLFIEDANLLDQRITAKVAPPYPFTKMMQIKKWKFRDSNFSADFPTNVEKAKYFYRLSGRGSDFDAVIAVNASVLNRALEITGPITLGGYGTYTSEDAVLKLEEFVEKKYLMNEDLDTQNRKAVMKKLAPAVADKLLTAENFKKTIDLALDELRNKDVMLNFENPEAQKMIEEVRWGGIVDTTWDGDYLMLVDANLGALKSDYFMKRDIFYDVDLTLEKPTATLNYTYTHTAKFGDWRTSDYHSYLRMYVPKGSNLLERHMVSYPNIQEEFGKTYFGFIAHTLINRQTKAVIKYELPDFVKEDYKLYIQKQSGVGDVPVKVHVKTADGEFNQELILKKDVKLIFDK
ncbi:DUF4012 domain-containing protein [bacterium]|jgi:hypothetical protein|nr:DUF4012 domain-containing protein [bacterium]MBT4251685.1 DUF4012 domain-containing protein [bacterium]MBT4597735.1 DUF4012 domain-containing protein [bacterium]MBT6753747.1 DUF4012 domain-containing protein [bacterium]MBT7992616.1 DUF4012 domain-containing protein [bacterium]